MDIIEFLQQSAGKWVSQRTSHQFATQQTGSSRSNIVVEMLLKDDLAVVKLCQRYQIDPAQSLCGLRITWDSIPERGEQKRAGTTLLVPIANQDSDREGKLLWDAGPAESASEPGRFVLGEDDALTLITGSDTFSAEERLWFASPNLRLRTSTLKSAGGFSMATFSSEIRMGGVQPPVSSTPSEVNS
ncbi:MAG: phycobiliprotein lyase [Oscillatoriophycideae cyanobacterium NC_groundwater_1537_Pr4_S-0.65um_50_18]|nr:phycobiliprotein lyase [Oscillatoriophycideae cyanobacterium NC_groundwater_1537_Pr4_S-0.65um_50_18]